MKILATGGAGFVGASLVLSLKELRPATEIVALDNLHRSGSELNVPRLRAHGIDFVHGDIRNPGDLELAGPFDLLIECSAEPSVLAGYGGSPRYVIDTNLLGTVNCLEAAREQGAAFIFLSTSRVYPVEHLRRLDYEETETRFVLKEEQPMAGASAHGITEAFPLEGTRSMYGATKLCSEYLIQEYISMYGMKAVINRCSLISGPWQMGKVDQGVIVLWVARHIFGGALNYIGYEGRGKQVRDVLHIADLCRLIAHQIDHLDELSGELFNVGGGEEGSTSLLELTEICREVTGMHIQIDSDAGDRPADIPHFISDNSKVIAQTGWHPEHNVRRCVEDIHTWIKANEEVLKPILGS